MRHFSNRRHSFDEEKVNVTSRSRLPKGLALFWTKFSKAAAGTRKNTVPGRRKRGLDLT